MAPSVPVLALKDVWKSYAGEAVLKGVNLSVSEGEFVGISAPLGQGSRPCSG